ncbi:MAG: thioredoxin [Mucilaginibacter sp.]|nr:thioredoxin [Mucilaginibacter sp.]
MKRKITAGNILYALFMIIVLITIINPTAKGFMIRGLMHIGLFQPTVPDPSASKHLLNSQFNISFRDTSGRLVNTADLKGKVVFVNFWATWCPPCIAEMPSVNDLYERFKNNHNVVFILADVDNDYPKAKSFLQKNNFNLPWYSLTSQVPDNLMDGTIPTTLIFDKNGKLVYQHSGATDYSNNKFVSFLSSISK